MYLPDHNPTPRADIPGRGISIPHPVECEPRRARRVPRWMPPARDPRDAGAPRLSETEGWHSPRIVMANEASGEVRNPLNWTTPHTSTAGAMVLKANRPQYTEGPHERAYRRLLEASSHIVDFQFQIATISWLTAAGKVRSYTFDGGRQEESGRIVFFENKADVAFFRDPRTTDTLACARAHLARYDVGLEEIAGSAFDTITNRIVDSILCDRRATYDAATTDRVHSLIAREGGTAPLARVREAIHPVARNAEHVSHRMLLDRRIGFPVDRPVTGDTQVRIPSILPPGSRTLRTLTFGS